MAKRFLSLLFAFILLLGVSPVSPWEIAWAEELPELRGTLSPEKDASVGAAPEDKTNSTDITLPVDIFPSHEDEGNNTFGDFYLISSEKEATVERPLVLYLCTKRADILGVQFQISIEGRLRLSSYGCLESNWEAASNGSNILVYGNHPVNTVSIEMDTIAHRPILRLAFEAPAANPVNDEASVRLSNFVAATTGMNEMEFSAITWNGPVSCIQCGDDLTWEVTDGILSISGKGEMWHYSQGETPWNTYRDSIDTIILSDGVTSISDFAFYDFQSVRSVSLPAGLKKIGAWAFSNCYHLESITLPDSVTSIGQYGFFLCQSLQALTLPAELQRIETESFSFCHQLNSITLNENLSEIQSRVFYNCSNLSEIHIPDSVTTVSPEAFVGCNATITFSENSQVFSKEDGILYSGDRTILYRCDIGKSGVVTIPDGVTRIAYAAFAGCRSLAEIQLPNSVTDIEYYAFADCASLKAINIPEGVTKIGMSALDGCSSLEQIVLPVGVTTIMYGAFHGCSSLHNISLPQSLSRIDMWAFADCSSLSHISLPNHLSRIASWAFENCSALEEILLPESVQELGGSVFRGCAALKTVEIDAPLQQIPDSAFSLCSSLDDISLPDTIKEIDSDAFWRCQSLSYIHLPEGIEAIHGYAFAYCTNLGTVSLPASLTFLSHSAFYGCTATLQFAENGMMKEENGLILSSDGKVLFGCPSEVVGELILPEGITEIGESAFSGQTKMTGIQMPSTLRRIGAWAFSSCFGLSSIAIPSGVTRLEAGTFSECRSLNEMRIPSSIVSIAEACFSGCSSLQEITLPDEITVIGQAAFSNCDALECIVIPCSVTRIDYLAFGGNRNLKYAIVPETVRWIAYNAFIGCSAMESVYYGGTESDWALLMANGAGQNALSDIQVLCQNTVLTGALFRQNGIAVHLAKNGSDEPVAQSVCEEHICNLGVISDGVYDITISKQGCVPYKTQVTVAGGNLSIDTAFELVAPGNLNGAAVGDTDAGTDDMQCLFEYLSLGDITGVLQGHEEYFRQVADVNGDESVNILDYQTLYEVIKGEMDAPDENRMHIAMVTDYGPVNDQAFNQAAYEACAEWAGANDVDFAYYIPDSDCDADRVAAIERAVDAGADTIVLPSFAHGNSLATVAPKYSDVSFIGLDITAFNLKMGGLNTLPSNLYSAVYQEEVAGYMAGYAAVKMGYTRLGFLGGMAVPAVMRYGYGFVQGVDDAAADLGKTDVTVKYAYANQFYGDAYITTCMDTWYQSGVEVVFACGGGVFTSVGQAAAKIEGAKVIGVDVDQSATIDGFFGMGLTVTSAMKGLGATVKTQLTRVKKGTFQGGQVETLGIVSDEPQDNYVQLPLGTTQWCSTFTANDYKVLVAKLNDGTITVDNDVTKNATDFATVISVDDIGNLR